MRDPNPERLVVCPDHTVLVCGCGGELILLGREEDWYAEGRTTFECGECGGELSLAGHSEEREPAFVPSFGEEAMSVRDLLRTLRAAGR